MKTCSRCSSENFAVAPCGRCRVLLCAVCFEDGHDRCDVVPSAPAESLWDRLVVNAAHVWVRDLDFRTVGPGAGYARADLIIDDCMGHPDGIMREQRAPGSGQPMSIKPKRYRAVLVLIDIDD